MFTAKLIQVLYGKTGCLYVSLCRHYSSESSSNTKKAWESSSNAQKTWQVFESAIKKNYLVLGFGFFVSDVKSGVLLGHFDPLHLALGLNRQMAVFHWSFYWKLG